MKNIKKQISRKERVNAVNNIIKEISIRGRKFFTNNNNVAEIVDNGRIYYKAEYGKTKMICLSIPEYRTPKGWFHGGTLLQLVKEFSWYIKYGESREYSALKSPHWGYPEEDMTSIRNLAIELGFLK